MRRFTRILLVAPLALGLAHCTGDEGDPREYEPSAQQVTSVDAGIVSLDAGARADARVAPVDGGVTLPFAITSSVVKEGERINDAYRCNVDSPPLSWTAGPAGTQSYALVLRDQGNGFYHWVIYDLPASTLGLPKGVPLGATLTQPAGAKQSPNWSRRAGYGGPCGGRNVSNYAFTLYALDVATLPGVTATTTAANVVKAIEAHDLASTKLSVTSSAP
jgi:Raf kinase inhibitor-like YbhB/YbcL family protein